jgi:hypothetical protein
VTCSVVNSCFRWLLSFIWLAPCRYRPLWREGQEHFCPTLPQTEKWRHPYSTFWRPPPDREVTTIFGL